MTADAGAAAEIRLSVPEMDCASCASTVEASLSDLEGVVSVEPTPASGSVVVRYDPVITTEGAIVERIESAGYQVDSETESVAFDVPEMDCASCARTVEGALSGIDGVGEIETMPGAGRVVVTYADVETPEVLADAIEAAGYEVVDTQREGTPSSTAVWKSGSARRTYLGAVLLVGGSLPEFVFGGLNPILIEVFGRELTVSWVAFVAAAVVAGTGIIRSGIRSARARSLDIDLLMSVGIVAALIVWLPFEAATLAVLYSLAELLERYSMDRARSSLRQLVELSPDTAVVMRGTDEETVPVESVDVDETVVVRPGEKIPLDGVVRHGQSAVDESPITGESVPADKEPGADVFAGSLNESGYLEVEVTAAAADSTLSRIIRQVEDAERAKTERERFVDRFARYYTPAIVIGAILTVSFSPVVFGVGWREAFVRGLTLLVIACPCAFVISTPVSVVSGVTSAARNGVLIKGGRHLETMGGVDIIAMDKTGTVTTGELAVTDIIPLGKATNADVLECAWALESRSEHPIATAITDRAEAFDIDDVSITDFEALPGRGVRATLDGETHYAGKPALFDDLGFDLGHVHVATDGGIVLEDEPKGCEHGAYLDLANETIPRLQAEGKTIVLVGTEDEIEGIIAVADEIRPDAARTVERLHDLGVEVAMLTGDNERTARAVAGVAGIDEVRAGLLPDEKVAAIEDLGQDRTIAMVGDGVNDAPALAAADVGIAMGAAGTDTAIETADIALMADDLSKLPYLARLSRKANGVIRQNIGSSLAVKAALALGAPLGVVSVIVAIVVGDMGMSLAVTGNAMRLAGVAPEE